MREILFRGKAVDSGEWLYGDLLQSDYSDGRKFRSIMGDNMNGGNTAGWNMQVDPDTVGQFVSLFDCHGTRIFEGDIVKIDGKCHEVVCDGWRFITRGRDVSMPALGLGVVIGNVHDNPELMGGGVAP